MTNSIERIRYVDFLKAIGLFLIMLAHVKCPDLLSMIRCFDVPLMVILSGFLASHSFQRRYPDGRCGIRYFWNRFKRLVIPTWVFLFIYFVVQAASGFSASLDFYLASFALTRYGIGYVWIILVYLYCALLIPFIHKLSLYRIWPIVILSIYALYEVLFNLNIGTENIVVLNTVYYIIPYGLMTALGYNYSRMTSGIKIGVIAASGLITLGCGIFYYQQTGDIQRFQIAKYPPQCYFVSWGIFASFLLMYVCEKWDMKIYRNRLIEFFSKHSLWIYLWHILIITTLNHTSIKNIWWLELLILVPASSFIVWIQNVIIKKIEAKKTYKVLTYFKY